MLNYDIILVVKEREEILMLLTETLTLVFVTDNELDEVQTNSWLQLKEYMQDSPAYMLTNFEGTIIESKGMSILLSFI